MNFYSEIEMSDLEKKHKAYLEKLSRLEATCRSQMDLCSSRTSDSVRVYSASIIVINWTLLTSSESFSSVIDINRYLISLSLVSSFIAIVIDYYHYNYFYKVFESQFNFFTKKRKLINKTHFFEDIDSIQLYVNREDEAEYRKLIYNSKILFLYISAVSILIQILLSLSNYLNQ
jgi:hypothetical protein